MATYKSKPTTVEAEQFLDPRKPPRGVRVRWKTPRANLEWKAFICPHGDLELRVFLGDWIIAVPDDPTGNHHYSMQGKEFKAKYEPVKTETNLPGSAQI